MKGPKTKPDAPPPKTLVQSIRTAKGVKTSISKSADNIHKVNKANNALQKHMPDDQRYDKSEDYATEQVIEKGGYVTRKAGSKMAEGAKKAAKKGYEKIREHHQIRQRDKSDKAFSDDVKDKQKSRTGSQSQRGTQKKTARSTKARQTQNGKQTVKNAIHTGKRNEKNSKDNSKKRQEYKTCGESDA